MKRYQVLVGNVGEVHDGNNAMQAWACYKAYIQVSKSGAGRAAGEPVTLFDRNTIKAEYLGTLETQDC